MKTTSLNDMFGYLAATDQVDEFLGLKEEKEKCINCESELYIYEGNIYYCPFCKTLTEYNTTRKVNNKKLTYNQKQQINSK